MFEIPVRLKISRFTLANPPEHFDAKSVIPIILSGGSGTRLWPVSRGSFPKQFCEFFDESLLVKTFKRLAPLGKPSIITVESMKVLTEKSLRIFELESAQMLFEPQARNTAAAIAYLCREFQLQGKQEEVVGIFPADHMIEHETKFFQAVKLAVQCAKQGQVVTLGIKPTFAATGYGYIEIGVEKVASSIDEISAHRAIGFREKPALAQAQEFVDSGKFFWNAGMFVFQVKTMIQHFERLMPEIWAPLQALKKDHSNLKEIYPKLKAESIDYGIMEKLSSDELCCIPADLGWNDVGSWDEISKFVRDESPQTINENAKNNFVFPHRDKAYALIGVNDLIIVDTEDALLVSARGQTQKVKQIVEKLKPDVKHRDIEHPFEYRPWGYFEVIRDTDEFKSKILRVNPSSQLSYQSHKNRQEHWVVIKGVAEVVLDGKTHRLQPGESIYIPRGSKHRLRNPLPDQLLEVVEVQTGSYFGEDDIQRYEDDYARTKEV